MSWTVKTLLVLVIVLALLTTCADNAADDPIALADERTAPAATACDYVLVGRVNRVIDADTADVILDSGPIRVRLGSIDAPERAQPYGPEATNWLRELIDGKEVELCVETQDQYDRIVAKIYLGDLDVNAELVRQGAAWAYREYLSDPSFLTIEEEARCAQRGLWAEPVVPPWDWRRGARQAKRYSCERDETPSEEPQATFACGTKSFCRDMRSCQEATFHFKQCGLASLDGNDDGVPCENLCP